MKHTLITLLAAATLVACQPTANNSENSLENKRTQTAATAAQKHMTMKTVTFDSEGLSLSGNLYYPPTTKKASNTLPWWFLAAGLL